LPPAKQKNARLYPWAAAQIRKVDTAQQNFFRRADGRSEVVGSEFETCHQNCLAGPSINLEERLLSPELNVPMNMLEDPETRMFKEFLANPSAFRAKSKCLRLAVLGRVNQSATCLNMGFESGDAKIRLIKSPVSYGERTR